MPGSEDHPLLTRYPDSYIKWYDTEKYIEYDLATGPVTGYRYIEERDTIAGQLTRITYYLDKTNEELSIGEVYQDNLQALQNAGITILAKGYHAEAKPYGEIGMTGWIGIALGPNPFGNGLPPNNLFAGTSTSGGTFSIIGKINRPDGNTYIAIYGERHSDQLALYHVDIIEEEAADVGYVSADADYIKKAIDETGSVSIYGIHFKTDSAEITEESAPAIDEMVTYLTNDPTVQIFIVGHTDMQGSLDYNLQLSADRANAVMNALVEAGISKDRLQAHGVGFLAPKATNANEDGRKMNRRTELVKKGTN